MRRLGRVLKLDIEEIFGDVDEVLQVECPAEDHFQWQCGHPEQQLCEDHEAEVAHSLVEGLEPFHGEERWECDEVETDLDEAGWVGVLVRGHVESEPVEVEEFGEHDVVECFEFMDVPVLVDAEDVPVGSSEEGAEHDHRDPEADETDEECGNGEGTLSEDVVAVSDPIEVDVGDGHQSTEDHGGKDDTGEPRVVVDEHFLEAEEVPGCLGGVGCLGARGGFFEWCFQRDAPDDQQRGDRDHADQFAVDQVGPDEHFFVLVVFEDRYGPFAVPVG